MEPGPRLRHAWPPYAAAALLVGVATGITWLVVPHVALANGIMVYLVSVLVIATRFGRGPSLLASVLSVAAFNFFFVPPSFTFAVADTQYLITFAVMFAVALVISDLAARIRAQADSARSRESRTAALYAMSRELGSARAVPDVLAASGRHVAEVFGAEVTFLFPTAEGALASPAGVAAGFSPDASDRAVARTVLDSRQPAGLGTTSARALYVPLVASRGALGVLGVRPPDPHALDAPEQRHLLETFANQTALALERAQLAEEAHEAELHAEAERMKSSLLSSVSHDLRTPLATITGAATLLLGSDSRVDDAARRELLESVRDEAGRLNRLVENLLAMTRLESGALPLHRDWHPVEEVVGAAIRRLDKLLSGRVYVKLAADLPLVLMDDVLVEQVLTNLLDNALKYTPAGTPIRIEATASEGRITVEIADRGPGLRPGDEERVFEKFYRGSGTSARGAGLGLAIVKAIVQAHGGRVWAHALPEGGVAFFFTLPMTQTPPVIVPAHG